jgi:hypothetical protein
MTDQPLRPATRDEVVQALAHGLRFEGRRRAHHADELMARIAAEKLADYLSRSNFIVMNGPVAPAHSISTHPSSETA